MDKIVPCLWFNGCAEEAVAFYTSVFRDARTGLVTHFGKSGAEASGQPEGSVLTIDFQLEGQDFQALNGGPQFQFSPAISLVVNCQTQREIDELWERLSEGGEKGECGWLTDRFGVTWQIVPAVIADMMQDPDAERVERMMVALLQMGKLDIEALKRAFEGG